MQDDRHPAIQSGWPTTKMEGRDSCRPSHEELYAGGVALFSSLPPSAASAQTDVSPAEARAIAKEAYIYGFPMVDSYRIQYAYFVDHEAPNSKRPGTRSATSLASIRRTTRRFRRPTRTRPIPGWAWTCAPNPSC